jgi:hypothetical protein
MQNLITIFLLLVGTLCHAQTPNFFADGARWVYSTGEGSEPGQVWNTSSEEQTIIHGDTAISGLTYSKLYTTRHTIVEIFNPMPPHPQYYHYYNSTGPAFLRYDTVLNRVYYLPSIDSTERLIYDFTLQVGDATPMQAEYFPFTTIRLIDTVTVFGVPLRRFFLTDDTQLTAEGRNFILEGIGGSNGLTFYQPEATLLSGGIPMTVINCFQYQDSIYAPYGGECPFIDFISTVDPIEEDHTLTVSPNPTQGSFTMIISEDLLNTTCTIVNSVGQVIQTFKLMELHTSAQLNTPGIYFWRVEQDGRLLKTGKLICE